MIRTYTEPELLTALANLHWHVEHHGRAYHPPTRCVILADGEGGGTLTWTALLTTYEGLRCACYADLGDIR